MTRHSSLIVAMSRLSYLKVLVESSVFMTTSSDDVTSGGPCGVSEKSYLTKT